MTRLTRRDTLLGGGAAALLTALPEPAAANLPRVLRVGLASHVSTLDTASDASNAGAQMTYSLHNTLIERDVTSARPVFRPGLATAWRRESDTATVVDLRPNVRMHDGTIMDADDVAFSLNRIFKREHPRHGTVWGRFFYNFREVEILSPTTVRIHTHRPEPLFETLLSDMAGSILSKEAFDQMGFDRFQQAAPGAGPYKMVEFQPNRRLVVERHDGFFGERPPFERIEFVRVPELATRITALVNNELDFIAQVPPQQEAALARNTRVRLVNVTWAMFHVFAMNMNHPAMRDPRIREALKISVDRNALNRAIWRGRGIVPAAHQFADYGEPLYHPGLNLITHDPARARALLREANYDGTPIQLPFLATYYTHNDLAAQAMKEMWEAVGFRVQLQGLEDITDNAAVMLRPWSNPMYYPDPMGAFDTHWSEAGWPFRQNLWQPRNPAWKDVYARARFSLNVAERAAAYRQLMEISEAEHGWILLYQPNENFAMRRDLEWAVPPGMRPYTLTFRAGQIRAAAG